MAESATFNTLYKKLNPEQKKAVDAIEGPVMVVAGPGTGKTQILTLRIAHIIKKTDTPPDAILALTFTESGVFSMRKRLVEIIGSAAYRVRIHTFHGFCNDVIKRFPDEFPRIIGSENLTDIDKLTMLRTIILNSSLSKLKPFGDNFYYLNPIRSKIGELKREYITPEQFEASSKEEEKAFKSLDDLYYESGKHEGKMRGKYQAWEKQIEKNKELVEVYKLYEAQLRFEKRYDYEDMIVEVISSLEKNSDLLLRLQEEYHYILADEHQDANFSQNRLLELLASFHDNPNLFIVGDEKQAIFRFQGATLDNFSYFKTLYPSAEVVMLSVGYRSHQTILDSAHSLISEESSEHIPLTSFIGDGGKVSVRSFSKEDFEHAFLTHDIKQKLDRGVPPHEIAVLYRTNRNADALMRMFEKADIPFVVESDQNVLHDADMRKLILLFRTAGDIGNDALLLQALHINFLGIEMLDIYRLMQYARKGRTNLYDILKSKKELTNARVEDVSELHELYMSIRSWSESGHNTTALEFFDTIVNESGFLKYVLSLPQAADKLDKLTSFFHDIQMLSGAHKDWRLPELLDYLVMLEEHNIVVKKESRISVPKSVRLMTAHKSKGLEFDFVYIVGARDTHWGNRRDINHFKGHSATAVDTNAEERRLFYVALTRARHGVAISYARENEGGRQQLPAQFIEEINPQYRQEESMESFEKEIHKEALFKKKENTSIPSISDKAFLNQLFIEQGLSVTALNNFLKSPWQYFYANLLRVPAVPSKHQLYGIAIHAALKYYFDSFKEGKDIGEKKLCAVFNESLRRQPMTDIEYEESLEKGTASLSGYYNHYKNTWGSTILNEFMVSVDLPLEIPELPTINVRGIFDKVVIEGDTVTVVDYKTGKPKTRGEIEGSTKDSNGDYKRQLVFYKLLLSLHNNGQYTMTHGEIEFVEPDVKGKYHKERFEITDEDVEVLKAEIRDASESILSLDFWEKPCDPSVCNFCELRELLM
ncbi:MAG: ATP-dependent DNA helicase [Candidatus Paceibacterota bacterium]